MLKLKWLLLSGILSVVSLYFFCTSDPTSLPDNADPESAYSTIILSSKSDQSKIISNNAIMANVGSDIDVDIVLYLGFFIDSICCEALSVQPVVDGDSVDTTIKVRFSDNDVRDTLRYTIPFTIAGEKKIKVTTYKKLGYISIATATVFINPVDSNNNPPVFLVDAPKNAYRFKDGELVRFAIGATDVDGDSLSFSFLSIITPLP